VLFGVIFKATGMLIAGIALVIVSGLGNQGVPSPWIITAGRAGGRLRAGLCLGPQAPHSRFAPTSNQCNRPSASAAARKPGMDLLEQPTSASASRSRSATCSTASSACSWARSSACCRASAVATISMLCSRRPSCCRRSPRSSLAGIYGARNGGSTTAILK
jgi:hypothetical protein